MIVGAGASGAAAALVLAEAGLRVVCLEQGGWLDQRAAPSLEAGWERALQTTFHINPNIRRLPSDYPVVEADTPIHPALYTGVGGSTLRWGAHFPRMRPADFRARTLDGVGEDWPLAYQDLEPFYDRVDEITGVAGLHGDPANPPRQAARQRPLPLGPGPTRLAAAFDRLGWHWWPSDAAVLTEARAADQRSACNLCGPCGVGCPLHARASADTAWWPRALAAGAELRTHARVLRIERGRVLYMRGAELRAQPARAIVLAASGLGTPRLLLASGLGGWATGRHLMHHPTAVITGLFEESLDGHKGPFACALYSQEFIEDDPARGFRRGYQMQALRGGGPVQTALGGYMARLPWGRGHHAAFKATFGHSVSLTVTAEDPPDAENRVTLDAAVTDSDGLPAPRLSYRLDANARTMLDHGIARATEALREAGATRVMVNPLVAAAGFHFLGTTRMGADPRSSVVDDACRVHDAPEVVVVDGGVFVTAGAVNPTPTIQAIALRAATLLAARLKGGTA
ncbi:GMC oxidoreductase [Falsiroseomonas sp.]|uniref:GMC oxidoreductase n=1 Tax=Falsiroseomonas sp. TaxID=2870721 RepID=UPI00356391B5